MPATACYTAPCQRSCRVVHTTDFQLRGVMVPHRLASHALKNVLSGCALSVMSVMSLAVALPAAAQDAPAPAHIAIIDGTATLERDGQSDPVVGNAPFVPGDRLRTTTGRVEVL